MSCVVVRESVVQYVNMCYVYTKEYTGCPKIQDPEAIIYLNTDITIKTQIYSLGLHKYTLKSILRS